MTKKKSLMLSDKVRPNIIPLFNAWVKRRVKTERERWKRAYSCYDEEYEDEMEALRRYYGCCGMVLNPLDDDEWDEDDYDDYYVGDDGEIVFPVANTSQKDLETTVRPYEYHRSRQDMDDYWNKMSKFNERGKHKHTKHRNKAKVIDINEPYSANYIDDGVNAGGIIYFYEDYHDKYTRIEFNNLYDFDEYCTEMGFTVPKYIAEEIAYSPISHCCLNPTAREGGVLEVMRAETYGDMFYEACETDELSNT